MEKEKIKPTKKNFNCFIVYNQKNTIQQFKYNTFRIKKIKKKQYSKRMIKKTLLNILEKTPKTSQVFYFQMIQI